MSPDNRQSRHSSVRLSLKLCTMKHNDHYQTQERAGGYRGCLVIAILRCGTGDTETPGPAKCQKDASARVNQNSWPVDKTRTMPWPARVHSANEWTDPPLASRAGARAFNTERSTSWGVKFFGSPLVFPLLVYSRLRVHR